LSNNQTPTDPSIFLGVDFLLSHLSKPDFPRTIATKATEGKQLVVISKDEALSFYKSANYLDCRLAAYPYSLNKTPQLIDFVMLDLDLNNFKYSRQKLEKALNQILRSLNIKPTVIWSGNGYHVLIPIEPMSRPLEDMSEFARFTDPSKKILRFLEKRLSNGKSDSVHNSTVSFSNCMLRVPGSFNSKHGNNGQVYVVKQWNKQRLSIKPLLGNFLTYLLDEQNTKAHNTHNYYNYKHNNLLSKP
jgi:hypothetical protein